MSFTFNWPRFSDQFHYDAIQMLNTALNKGNKPPVIADKIEVVELEMGTQPPELEIRDIGDLTVDQFRGIFRMTYSGDAHLVLKTKVQANPLNHKQPDIHLMTGSRGMLAAKHSLVVPMLLRLSHFHLSSYVVLVVSKQKGITLVFKTDPLQNVDINSTFDSIAVIQNFIQREIEGQLRQMFREDLPGIIHRLSQQWVKAKVEAPYLSKRPPPPTPHRSLDAQSTPDIHMHRSLKPILDGHPLSRKSSLNSLGFRRPRSTSGVSTAKLPKPIATDSPHIPSLDSQASSHPDLENFDPTYGLRPEGLPIKSVFRGFSSLFTPNKGLADLAEEGETSDYDDEEYEEDDGGSFDLVDWDDNPPRSSPPQSIANERPHENSTEYETIPAVGGGTITRPRIYHSQSAVNTHPAVHPLSKSLPALSRRTYSQTGILRSGMATPLLARTPSTASNPYFPEYPAGPSRLAGFAGSAIVSDASYRTAHGRPPSPDSLESQPSRSSSGPAQTLSTDPTDPAAYDVPPFSSTFLAPSSATATSAIYMRRPPSERRMSVTSNSTNNTTGEFLSTAPSQHAQESSGDTIGHPKIVLRPTLNSNSIHHLSTLSHSNHTLSPYTRDLSHFTVRSVPPRYPNVGSHRGGTPSGGVPGLERPLVKAKRKRTYRLGGNKTTVPPVDSTSTKMGQIPPPSTSPTPPSEFDVSDMDRYFPADAYESVQKPLRPPPLHPTPYGSALGNGNGVATGTATDISIRQRLRPAYND